jgi:hypothetical protein
MSKTPYRTACRLQTILENSIESPLTDKKLIAAMATAWERLEERKRILRMRPRPRDIDTTRITRSSSQPVRLFIDRSAQSNSAR